MAAQNIARQEMQAEIQIKKGGAERGARKFLEHKNILENR